MKKKIKSIKKKDLPLLKRALNLEDTAKKARGVWLREQTMLKETIDEQIPVSLPLTESYFGKAIDEHELEYIKIPLVGARTKESLGNALSDLLCWFQGLEFGTPDERKMFLEMARNGIKVVRDIKVYIDKPVK